MADNRKLNTRYTQVGWNDSNYLIRMQESLDWIESLGVKIPPAGRHRKYIKELKKIERRRLSENLLRPSPSAGSATLSARYETHEIDRIVRIFEHQEPKGIRSKFESVLGGSYHFYDDRGGKSAHARNILAELTAGSYYIKNGFSVSYGSDLYPEPLVEVSGMRYANQCKRLASNSSSAASRNLKKAATQISANVSDKPEIDGGIIFIDLSSILLPKGLRVSVPLGVSAEENYARKLMVKFMRENVFLFPWAKFPAVHGIVLRGAYFINTADDEFNLDRYVNQIMCRERPEGCLLLKTLTNDSLKNNLELEAYNSNVITTVMSD